MNFARNITNRCLLLAIILIFLVVDGAKSVAWDDLLNASKEAVEAISRARAQKHLGRNLKNSLDPAFDYVDDLGRTYDQMGNPAMIPHWPRQKGQFFNQIDRHLQKADFTVIDLTDFPKHIRDEVADYVLNLPEHLFDKVIPIGF